MIRKLTYLLIALVAMGLAVSAQAQMRCGFDEAHNQLLSNNPTYSQRVNVFNNNWANVNQGQYPNLPQGLITNTPQGVVYEIPVVIHVIHTGGAVGTTYNPTDARLTAMIDYLNASYATTWAAYPDSLNGGTRFPVKFVLAKRNPSCGSTTGINRVNGSSLTGYTAGGVAHNTSTGASETAVKALSNWDHHDYYNIWIVNRIDGEDGVSPTAPFVAGYAYFPGAPATLDGTIMLATQAVAGEITLPHEIGHAFSLYHTFQGGTTSVCPTNANCATDGDRICDTEPQRQSNFNCPSDPNPCTGLSYNFVQHNFMDYSSCQDRFTRGQRTRFLSSMMVDRASLLSSLGLVAPATPAVTAASCIPTITNPTNTFNAGPYNVTLADMTGTSEGGYNSDGNRVYIDRSCIQRANVIVGQSYTLTVSTGPNAERVRVYIDWNNDGVFGTTAPEMVYAHDGTSSYETHATTITIPTTGVVTCVPLRMRVVSDRTTAAVPTPCGALAYGQAEDFSVNVKGPSNTGTVSIAQTAGTNPSCINTSLTFTATPGGSVTTPTYKWYVNGVAVTAFTTGTTYTSSTLANGDVVTARIFYTGPCGADSSLSNSITVGRFTTIVPSVTVALTSGTNPGCPGQSLTFSATPTNGGTTPTYQWQTSPDGITWTNVTGATAATYSTSTLTCGYRVRVIMTSALTCAVPTSATSAAITYSCSATGNVATAVITQTAGANPLCKGQSVTLTAAVTNPGTAPSYSWMVNGVTMATGTLTFTTNALNNGDTVQLLFVSNNPCVTQKVVLSNRIGFTVIPLDTPSVYVAITAGSNPGCADSLLEFTATASSSSGLSGYSWYVNNTKVATGTVYSSYSFANGDQVRVTVVAGPGCHVRDTAYSNTITITRYPAPATPVISFIGNMLVANMSNVQWYGPSGLIPGATGPSYHPAGPGSYYAVAIANGCPSLPSNVLQVSLLTIGNYDLSLVQIYPNPSSGLLNFDWGTKLTTATMSLYTPTGQIVQRDMIQNGTRKTIDISSLAAGIYFVVIQDNDGHTGTVKITLMK